MTSNNSNTRKTARQIARAHLDANDPLGWFEALYAKAGSDPSIIPWADLTPNPNFVDWLEKHPDLNPGRALKVGCGLGDDAQELACRGFDTTAFDISQTAIDWCKRRFAGSAVSYMVADLFCPPETWRAGFDFVLESYTLQVLPPLLRTDAMGRIASFVAPGGALLVIARGKEETEPGGGMPWPLTRKEMSRFADFGLSEISFEDYVDNEDPPVRRLRGIRDNPKTGLSTKVRLV